MRQDTIFNQKQQRRLLLGGECPILTKTGKGKDVSYLNRGEQRPIVPHAKERAFLQAKVPL